MPSKYQIAKNDPHPWGICNLSTYRRKQEDHKHKTTLKNQNETTRKQKQKQNAKMWGEMFPTLKDGRTCVLIGLIFGKQRIRY